MSTAHIHCHKNGPYEVKGEVTIVDANGKTVSSGGEQTYHLCRCGGSHTKPFCDGTHAKIQFKSE